MLKHWRRTLALLGVVAATGLICAAVALGGKKPPPPPQATVRYSMTVLGTLEGNGIAVPWGLNEAGEAVGASYYGDAPWRAFVYTSTDGMVDLNQLTGLDLYFATAINDSGQIAAWSASSDRAYRLSLVRDDEGGIVDALVEDIGAVLQEDVPEVAEEGTEIRVYGINERGDVCGEVIVWGDSGTATWSIGFVCLASDDGVLDDWAEIARGTGYVVPAAINAGGCVTGHFGAGTVGASTYAFLYTPDGEFTDLDPELYDTGHSYAYDISDAGVVVGQARTGQKVKGSFPSHAFLYTQDGTIDLGTLGGADSEARGINSGGEVVGWANETNGRTHGFLWTDKTTTGGFAMFKLQDLVVDLPSGFQGPIYPRRINDAGQICGHAVLGDGTTSAVLLTPVEQ
jgi:probable HAF family extracellular repeat protein